MLNRRDVLKIILAVLFENAVMPTYRWIMSFWPRTPLYIRGSLVGAPSQINGRSI